MEYGYVIPFEAIERAWKRPPSPLLPGLPPPPAISVRPDQFCGVDTGTNPLLAGARPYLKSAVVTAPIFRERATKARAMGQAPAIVRALENFAQNAPASADDIRPGQIVRVDLKAAGQYYDAHNTGIKSIQGQTYADVRVVANEQCSIGLGAFPGFPGLPGIPGGGFQR